MKFRKNQEKQPPIKRWIIEGRDLELELALYYYDGKTCEEIVEVILSGPFHFIEMLEGLPPEKLDEVSKCLTRLFGSSDDLGGGDAATLLRVIVARLKLGGEVPSAARENYRTILDQIGLQMEDFLTEMFPSAPLPGYFSEASELLGSTPDD